MKQFFKFFTASCLGTLAALAVLGLIGFAIMGYMSSLKPDVSSKTVLELDFSNAIPEKTDNVNTGDFDFEGKDYPGLRTIKRTIAHAATDPNISGIIISSKSIPVGQSTLMELVTEGEKFKESGKIVYAYADYYTQSGYLMASTADSVFLNPNGMIELVGFGSLVPFFKPVMDKIGFKFDIYYAGKFKSATEPFRLSSMSEPNKVQTKAFLNDMFNVYLEKLSELRDIDITTLNEIVNDFGGRTDDLSLENKLVDQLLYANDFNALVRKKIGLEENEKIEKLSIYKYISRVKLPRGKGKSKIAIVYAEGEIGYNNDNKGSIDDSRYLKLFERIKRKDDIKAIVIRVNSPGGSALTSDIIWNEIEELKADSIPIITSMGDYAASGGYYIACNSDVIVASPNTLTGSIGVFSMLPNMKEMMTKKIGVQFDTVKTHDFALMNNFVYDPNSREAQFMQESTDDLYQQFLSRVATGRGMTVEEVDEVAQGRVWSGKKAKELGLVDELGDLEYAINLAAEKAGLDEYKIVEYPTIEQDPFKEVIKAFNQNSNASINPYTMTSPQGKKLLESVKDMDRLLQMDKPMARMPYNIMYY